MTSKILVFVLLVTVVGSMAQNPGRLDESVSENDDAGMSVQNSAFVNEDATQSPEELARLARMHSTVGVGRAARE